MKAIAVYSGHKGGTGKSTLSIFLAIYLSLARKSVMLLDLGGSVDYILKNPSPPSISSLFLGEVEWYEAARYVKLGEKLAGTKFALIPSGGYIPPGVSWNQVNDIINSVNEFFDLLVIDLPADPSWTLMPENIPVILVLDESPSSRRVVEKMSNFSNHFIIFNKCRIRNRRFFSKSASTLIIPYDKNIASLNPSNLLNIYLSSSSRVLRPLNSCVRDVLEVEVEGNDKWLWKRAF